MSSDQIQGSPQLNAQSLPEVLETLYRECPTLPPDYVRNILGLSGETAEKVDRITGGIHRDEAELVAQVVAQEKPEVTLEIGLGHGFSALTICLTAAQNGKEHKHFVIDPHQTIAWQGRGMEHLRRAGVSDRVTLIEDLSCRALPQLEQQSLVCDFVFIDGWHTFDFVFADAFHSDRLLRPGGIMMFDDADWPSIRPVLRYFVTNLNYAVVATLPEKCEQTETDRYLGLSGSCIALRKPILPDTREIFFHESF
ncbi:MAG: class I SAM-dependent methyltransferase [Pseudoruegeria sp.]